MKIDFQNIKIRKVFLGIPAILYLICIMLSAFEIIKNYLKIWLLLTSTILFLTSFSILIYKDIKKDKL